MIADVRARSFNSSPLLERLTVTLERLLTEIEVESVKDNPTRLDSLSRAATRLLEQERILAGRPLPARPKDHKPPKRGASDKRESEIAEPLPELPAASQPAPVDVARSSAPDATS